VKKAKRIPFVGIGTGRCGTVSLSRIIGACRHVCCTHERFVTNWYTPKESRLIKLKNFLLESYESGELHGEIQPHLLPHVPLLRKWIPELRIICLHRPCEEVVALMMGESGPEDGPQDGPQDGPENGPENGPEGGQ